MVDGYWQFLHYPVMAAYLWWSCVWATVAYYYLGAGLKTWRQIDPDWPNNPLGALSLWVRGVGKMMTYGTRALFKGTFGQPAAESEHTQPQAMTLQQGICCSAFCSFVFGLTYAWVDRSANPWPRLALSSFAIAVSSVGGMIHLYPPMKIRKIKIWRVMMMVTWIVPLVTTTTAFAAWALGWVPPHLTYDSLP